MTYGTFACFVPNRYLRKGESRGTIMTYAFFLDKVPTNWGVE